MKNVLWLFLDYEKKNEFIYVIKRVVNIKLNMDWNFWFEGDVPLAATIIYATVFGIFMLCVMCKK
jgi:hypothetical protein